MAEIKKIKFLLEYECYPIWFVDNEGGEENEIPSEFPKSLRDALMDISDEYDGLFINNSYEFTFKGFSSTEENKIFKKKVAKVFDELKNYYRNKYELENCEVNKNYVA